MTDWIDNVQRDIAQKKADAERKRIADDKATHELRKQHDNTEKGRKAREQQICQLLHLRQKLQAVSSRLWNCGVVSEDDIWTKACLTFEYKEADYVFSIQNISGITTGYNLEEGKSTCEKICLEIEYSYSTSDFILKFYSNGSGLSGPVHKQMTFDESDLRGAERQAEEWLAEDWQERVNLHGRPLERKNSEENRSRAAKKEWDRIPKKYR